MLPRDERHPCAQHAVLLMLFSRDTAVQSPTCSNDASQEEKLRPHDARIAFDATKRQQRFEPGLQVKRQFQALERPLEATQDA